MSHYRLAAITRRGFVTHKPVANFTRNSRRKLYLYVTAGVLGTSLTTLYLSPLELGAVSRFCRSLSCGAAVSLDYWYHLYRLDEQSDRYREEIDKVHQRCADRLLKACLANGGLYIKIGQGLACLNHILPTQYVVTLSRLQDRCLERSGQELDRMFLQDFGNKPEEVYGVFDRHPIAAASLAQVYRAKTKDGRDVAVKVQYIDLQDRFHSDLLTLRLITSLVGYIHPKFQFSWILDDIEATLKQELDFVNEARNSERCAKELKHLDYVYVPEVLWDYTNTRIMTTEFIEGIKISDKNTLLRKGFSLNDIDSKLVTTFSEQIFNTGFVHADPHPGNVLIRKAHGNKTQVVLLDHGLYQTVPEHVRSSLCDFWKAIVMKDHSEMEKFANVLDVRDYEIFAEILTQRPLKMDSFGFRTGLSESELRYMTEMARDRFDKITDTLKQMPHHLIFVIRNLNTIRSITREHGDPIDRLRLMARTALRNKYGYFSLLRFEFIMWKSYLRLLFLRMYLRFLSFIGRAPDTSTLLQQIS